MSKLRILLWIVIPIIVGLSAAALWTLRQPLQQGIASIVQSGRSEPTVSFAVIGDNHGVNAVYQQAIKAIGQEPVDFLLNLADTSEFGRRQEFEAVRQLEKTLPFPVYHTVGSHDIKTDPSRGLYTEIFQQAANQTIDRGPLHLVILDNADRQIGFSDETLWWLSDDLEKNKDKTIILAYHRPFDLPLSAVTGDDETTASRASNEKFLDVIKPYDIRYILSAHLHTYLQYTLAGIPAVVSGGGGDPAQTILGGPTANFFHYLIITVKGQAVTIELRRLQL